jgi:HNH endonuclease
VARQKHIAWFRQGARTLRAVARARGFEHVFPTDEDWYLCPLCLDVWLTVDEFDTGELTIEDVPPQSLGGRELLLTCRKCNNEAGSKFDAEAAKQQKIWDLFSGRRGGPVTSSLTISGVTVRGDMYVTGPTSMILMGVQRINNPANIKRAEEHLLAIGQSNAEQCRFTVTPHIRYSPDRARVSWVRTAYLASFALLGWNYILQAALEPIRSQLLNPGKLRSR